MSEPVVPLAAIDQGGQFRFTENPNIPGLTDWRNTNFILYGYTSVRRDGIEYVTNDAPIRTLVLRVEYVGAYEHLTPTEGAHGDVARDAQRAGEWNVIKALADAHPRPLHADQIWEAIGWRRHLIGKVAVQDAIQRLEHPDRRFIMPVPPQGTYLPTGDALRYYVLNRRK